jgi:hypothetical protein
MAHFTNIRADLAAWVGNAIITAAEFWAFDEKLGKAINGDDGGVWAPTDPIEIGGDGLKVSGVLDVTGTAQFTGDVNIPDPGALNVTGDFSLNNAGMAIISTTTPGSGVITGGALKGVQIGASGSGGYCTLYRVLYMTNTGRVMKRPVIGANADTTFSAEANDMILVPTLTADRTYTLSRTGAEEGDVIDISKYYAGATYQILVSDSVAGPVLTMGVTTVWARFIYRSAADLGGIAGWRVLTRETG